MSPQKIKPFWRIYFVCLLWNYKMYPFHTHPTPQQPIYAPWAVAGEEAVEKSKPSLYKESVFSPCLGIVKEPPLFQQLSGSMKTRLGKKIPNLKTGPIMEFIIKMSFWFSCTKQLGEWEKIKVISPAGQRCKIELDKFFYRRLRGRGSGSVVPLSELWISASKYFNLMIQHYMGFYPGAMQMTLYKNNHIF